MIRIRAMKLATPLLAFGILGAALPLTAVATITPIGPPLELWPLAHRPASSTFWVPESQGIWSLTIPEVGNAIWQWSPVTNPSIFWSYGHSLVVMDDLPIDVRNDGTASQLLGAGCQFCNGYTWVPLSITGSPAAAGPVVADLARNRALMVGPLGEVSALTFGPGTGSWTTLPVIAPLPIAQFRPAITVDAERDRLILAGGYTLCGAYGQNPSYSAWSMPLAGPYQWTALPNVPFPGDGSDLVVDPDNDRLLWVGGYSFIDCEWGYNEQRSTNVHAMPLGVPNPSWSNLGSTPDIEPAASVWLEGHGLFIFGGRHIGPGYYADHESRAVFQAPSGAPLSFTIRARGTPYARAEPQISYHAGTDKLAYQGGIGAYSDQGDYGSFYDLWSWSPNSAWVESDYGPLITNAAMIADMAGEFFVFGGYRDSPAPLDPPVLSSRTYRVSDPFDSLAVPAGPSAREGSAAAYDPATNRMLVHGGTDATGLRTDLWSLDLDVPAWTQAQPTGFTPPAAAATLAWDEPRDRLLLAAESAPGNVVVWSADAALTTYTQLPTSGTGPEHAHSIAVDPNKPWAVVLDDSAKIWKLPFDAPHQWELIESSTRWLGRGRLFFRNYRGLLVYDNPPQLFDADARGVLDAPNPMPLPTPGLQLRIAGGNPARVPRVELSLPTAADARLELFDLAGRRVWAREVGSLGTGVHRIEVRERSLAAGVYTLRLVQGSERRAAKIVVLP